MVDLPLHQVFYEVMDFLGEGSIHAVETGCSYVWLPYAYHNLSTLNITTTLLDKGGHLVSIDNDQDHIDICREELEQRDLYSKVTFRHGDSIDVMEDLIDSQDRFNFFWLDSLEDAHHGLEEYNLALDLALGNKFVICIDDYDRPESAKWQLSGPQLINDASHYKTYTTSTGLIVGFYNGD